MLIILSLILVVAVSLLATNIQAQNNGDIRLVNSMNNAIDAFRGRLEVFIDGKWGTVCGKSGTNFQAVANIACRQLRSKEASLYGTVTQLGFPVATDTTPIHFGSINCPSTSLNSVCSTDYYQHLLRCTVDTNVDTTTCTRGKDIGVACSTEAITLNAYESQVAIYGVSGENHPPNISLSSGILGIFFTNLASLDSYVGRVSIKMLQTVLAVNSDTQMQTISIPHFRPQSRLYGQDLD